MEKKRHVLSSESSERIFGKHSGFRNLRAYQVAELVWDTPADRDKVVAYLRNIQKPEDIDLIIALGMAKEGILLGGGEL